jgi:phospholipase/carboxylesterase
MLDGPRWGPKQGRAEALVVLCHGVGADGYDLIDLAPWWAAALPQAAFVAPHAPEPYDGAPMGRQWFPLWDRTPALLEAGAEAAAAQLGGFIDAELARLGLADDAYALMGFSQGAMTVLHAGPRRAVPPRAVLAFSGALLAPLRLAETPSRPAVLLAHGEADEVVPASQSRAAEQALRQAGFAVETQYSPLLGHGIDEAGLTAGAMMLQRVFAA